MSDPDIESQSPPTSDPDELTASLPRYRPPEQTTDDLPSPPADGYYDEEPVGLGPPSTPTSSPASTRRGFPRAREVLDRMVTLVGRVVHSRLAPGPGQELWLADEQDLAEIAGPLASIVDRHAKIGDGTTANDVIDGVLAAVGIVGYVDKNLRRHAEMAAWMQQAEQNGPPS